MPGRSSSLLYCAPCADGLDAESFLSFARSIFSNVSEGDGRIRSGRHIPRGFKSLVSSYKVIGVHVPLMGGGRIEVAVVKLVPGAKPTKDSGELAAEFAEACAASCDADGLFVHIPPVGACRGFVALATSSSVKSVAVPPELMDFICAEGLKTYLHKNCGLSEAALDGYLSEDRILFDDSPIKMHAQKIDEALSSIRFCDIAASDGKIVSAFVEKIAAARVQLIRYLGAA